jgi:hypothetical protein
MAKLSTDFGVGVLHPRENPFVTGNIGALNSEVIIRCDGASTVSVEMRGTFNLFLDVQGSVDGTNWTQIPVRLQNVANKFYLATAGGNNAVGIYVGQCSQYRLVRARCSAYTSGLAVTTLMVSNAIPFFGLEDLITPGIVTAVGAAGAAVTLTVPGSGVGLRNYITYLSINRFATALLTAAAAPVTVTTTNLPGTLAFSMPADAAAQGTMDRWREDFAYPLASSAQNSTVTFVCPATTGVIWRVTAGYYVAP